MSDGADIVLAGSNNAQEDSTTLDEVGQRALNRLERTIKSFASMGSATPKQLVGDETPASSVIPVSGGRQLDALNQFVNCRYSIEGLTNIAMLNNGMRPLLDAMAVNLHGSGYRIKPKIKIEEPDADKEIKNQLFIEKAWMKDQGISADTTLEISEAEIAERRKQLEGAIPLEAARIQSFFKSCGLNKSFTEICVETAFDREGSGNAGWEIIRRPSDTRHNPRGSLARINYVPGWTIRLLRQDDYETPVMVKEPVTDLFNDEVLEGRRFRVYAHYVRGYVKHFKEFGDPRMISQETGEPLETPCARCEATGTYKGKNTAGEGVPCLLCAGTGIINPGARKRGDNEPIANELLHWKISNPLEEYGLPRWIGCFYEAVGSIESSALNWGWFASGMFGVMLIRSWGIDVTEESVAKVNRDLNALRGAEKQGGFLHIEGQPSAGVDPTRMHLEVDRFDQGHGDDALYQKYDANNREKLAECFRIPELLRGKVKNTNRATAIVELQMGEQQVFGPIRRAFDHVMNYVVFPEMGIRYHTFASNSPELTDPDQLARTIELLTRSGLLQIIEGRKYIAGVVGEELPKIEGEWQHEPLTLFLAKLQNLGSFLKAGYSLDQAIAALSGEHVPPPPNSSPGAPPNPTSPPPDPAEQGGAQKSVSPLLTSSVRAAGLAIQAMDTGRVLMLQRSLCEDDPAAGMWEFPGGKLDPKETPLKAAIREFEEETGVKKPRGQLTGSWVSPNGVYQGFVLRVKCEADVGINPHAEKRVLNPDDPDQDNIEVAAWWRIEDLPAMPALRHEVRATDWNVFKVT